MSRAERRAYKRMMKNQDPYALPARASAARNARSTRVRARRQRESGEFVFLSPRFLAWAVGGTLIAALLGLSVAWPNGMPTSLYAGLAAAAAWVVLAFGVRFMQRSTAARRAAP
jgi:hypothetical protein